MQAFDRDVPALLIRTGTPRWDYGGLATVRTLGRVGVPVYALARDEPELTRSTYLSAVVAPPLDMAEPLRAAESLRRIDAMMTGPTVAIAGDDESSVLLAENRGDLTNLLTFEVPAELPRQLSGKASLAALCAAHGVGSPPAVASADVDTLLDFADDVGYPVVVKAPHPFERQIDSAATRTRIVADRNELQEVLAAWPAGTEALVQEALDASHFDFSYVAGVADPAAGWHGFCGRKLLAHPNRTGVGTFSITADDTHQLREQTKRLCEELHYAGPFDTDWGVDRRTGQAWLIDFNPRRGAQFRLFTTSTDLDIVRAVHLRLTGRAVDWGRTITPRRYSVGNLSVIEPREWLTVRRSVGRVPGEGAWWAADDRAPSLAMSAEFAQGVGRKALAKGRGLAGINS